MANKTEKKEGADIKQKKRMVPRKELPDVEYLLRYGVPGKEGQSSPKTGGWSDIIVGPIGLLATFCISLFVFHFLYMDPNGSRSHVALNREAVKAKMKNMPPSVIDADVVSDETIEL